MNDCLFDQLINDVPDKLLCKTAINTNKKVRLIFFINHKIFLLYQRKKVIHFLCNVYTYSRTWYRSRIFVAVPAPGPVFCKQLRQLVLFFKRLRLQGANKMRLRLPALTIQGWGAGAGCFLLLGAGAA